jgi:Ca2+-binding RTX toxin-like protein
MAKITTFDLNILSSATGMTPNDFLVARPITLTADTTNPLGYENTAEYTGNYYVEPSGIFSFQGTAGATYGFVAASHYTPDGIAIANNLGKVIGLTYDTTDTADAIAVLTGFVAPYSGTYYIAAIFDKSTSDKSGTIFIGEDLDTATNIDATAIVRGKSATAGNDLLIGTNGKDKISGLAGNDTLVGGLGVDNLTGGLGADVFKFNASNETGKTSATRDVITDFKHSEGDKIDLSGIDANSKLAGNQAFKFIGSKSFSGNAGEVRFDSTNKILYGNANADKTPDFAIQLNGVKSLVIDDFVL